jgi:type II secretory pathway component PulF
MAEYAYRAVDHSGQTTHGTMAADGPDAVAQKLKQLGYVPVSIEEKKSAFAFPQGWLPLRRLRRSDLNMLTRQLATLQRAGISLLVSLNAIMEELDNPHLRSVLAEVCRAIEEGKSLSEALERHPTIFSKLYVQMVRAGETAGILDQMLDRLAQLGEHEEETAMQIRSATQYPVIVLTTITLVFVFLMAFVVPRFADLFTRFHSALPLPTRILLSISFVFQHYWWGVLFAVVLTMAAFRWFASTPRGRDFLDETVLKIPVFGPLFKKIYLSRFAQIVGLLAQGGVSIFETLQVAAGVVGNRSMERAIQEIARGITEGKGLSEPMKANRIFPPMLVHMVKVGEESGKMDELLLRASQHYDAHASYTIKHLGTLIEPMLLAVLGGMVLLLALGVFIPMWNMIYLFRH